MACNFEQRTIVNTNYKDNSLLNHTVLLLLKQWDNPKTDLMKILGKTLLTTTQLHIELHKMNSIS